MGKLQQLVRTRDSYYEKISGMSRSSHKAKKFAIQGFERFCKEQFSISPVEKLIDELKEEEENIIYDVIQKWINWESIDDIKNRFSHLNGYLYYHGIKISSQDVRHNLNFPKVKKRQPYGVKLEELQDIMSPVPYIKKALYLALVSSGMRIGEALRIQKKDLNFSRNRIQITIPAEIAKNGIERITWLSKEAEKYNIKKINKLDDDELVWGSSKPLHWENNVISQVIMFGRYTVKANLDMKYASGIRKITLHSLRSYFITKGNKVDFGFGHALGGHDYYMKRYDEDDLYDMYLKLEPHLGIFDLTLKNQEITELQKVNEKYQAIVNEKEKLEITIKSVVKSVLAEEKDCEPKKLKVG